MAADEDYPNVGLGDEEEDDEEGMLEAEDPIMDRIQFALKKQLKGAYDVAALKVSEQTEELTRKKRQREDIGVSLYAVQQQLAKLQMNLEKVHDNHAIIAQMRETAEEDLAKVRASYEVKYRDAKEHRAKAENYQGELDQLATTLRQVEAYNDQMKGEIAVTRRATYKAEESITQLEGGKRLQDEMIDKLNEQLKRSQEELALNEAQLMAQRGEAGAADQTLRDAWQEMEAIGYEKKQLLAQWKSALLGMQRRDEALQATENALHKQREQEQAIEGEVRGLKKMIKKEQEKNETLVATQNKLDAEMKVIMAGHAEVRRTELQHNEKFAMLNKSLEQTDIELTKVNQQHATLSAEVAAVETQLQRTLLDAKTVEDAVMANLGEQLATEKGTANTAKEAEQVRLEVQDKEMEQAQLQNELARLKVDALNTVSHNKQLEAQLKAINAELVEKDALMARYEAESRRRNTEVEKKAHDLDLLNRKFDGLMKARAGAEDLDEDAGPLEATILHLKKEIAAIQAESAQLQRAWIKNQTELVSVQNRNAVLGEDLSDKRAHYSILEQTRARIDAAHAAEKKEGVRLARLSDAMHTAMGRINRLVAEHSEKQQALADENFLTETEFVARLKELEQDAVATEAKIVALKEEKEGLLLDTVEAQKQTALLEKKISLERETQAALDPEVGAAEVRAMQREIHRMRLRYAQLQKRQDGMIVEMERAIYKRDNIEAKGKVHASQKGAAPTAAALQKQTAELNKKLKLTTHDANLAQMHVMQLQEAQRDKGQQVEDTHADVSELRTQGERVAATLRGQAQQETLQKQQLARNHKLAVTLMQAAGGAFQPSAEPEVLQESIADADAENTRLLGIIDELGQEQPQYAPQLSLLAQSISQR